MSKIVLANGLEIAVQSDVPLDTDVAEGITRTSARMAERTTEALENALAAIPATRLGEVIGQLAAELAAGVRDTAAVRGWDSEFEIGFGLVLGGEVNIRIASSKAEGSLKVAVRFRSPSRVTRAKRIRS